MNFFHKRNSTVILTLILSFLTVAKGEISWHETEIEKDIALGETEISAKFQFTNHSESSPVHISHIRTSCGCTSGNFSRTPVAPGEVGEVRLSFSAVGRRGTQRNNATVEFADNPGATQHLRFIVNIPELGRSLPQVAQWSEGGESTARQIRIVLNEAYESEIKALSYDEDKFSVELTTDESTPGEALLQIRPITPLHAMRSHLDVKLIGKQGHEASLRVFLLIRP